MSSFYFLCEVGFFLKSNFVYIKIIEVFEFKYITNTDKNQTFEYKLVVRIIVFFFFLFCM